MRILALLFLTLTLLLAPNTSLLSASRGSDEEPASEGHRITPAGKLLIDAATRQVAVGSLPVGFVRSPDHTGPDGRGRYLIAVNSGFGLQFNAAGNRGQQSLAVIDLNITSAPVVIQNVFFPSPQSVNVGLVFSPTADDDGSYALYASGGFENKIWLLRFQPGIKNPITPVSPGPNTMMEAPSIDIGGFATLAPSPRYNDDHAPVYPTGLAISADGNTLFVANNLSDSLGVISDLRGTRKLERIDLRRPSNQAHFLYPYGVVALPEAEPSGIRHGGTAKVYVSCWNDESIAVMDPARTTNPVSYIQVGRHPTAMLLNELRTRLLVVNSDDDSVSVIDTATDREIERINVRLAEKALLGSSPEGLALDGKTLYVANAHSDSVAVVQLSKRTAGGVDAPATSAADPERSGAEGERSTVRGFIPTGQYPSAVAVVGGSIFVGNGKGTGVENSSVVVNNSGRTPNAPNDRFPVGTGRDLKEGGQYSVSLVVGNISVVAQPDERALVEYTQSVMRNNGLLGAPVTKLFAGKSPINHIIYVIKENRSYDQVLGDVEKSGDGRRADGDPRLAIFGSGEAAKLTGGAAQEITPNFRALALRFGLFDRFFVNSEASPDGHNWSTAAFSSDYVDKAYRWQYSRRGRGYDYEGFNRLPAYEPMRNTPSMFGPGVSATDVANFMRRFIPYLNGSRDVAEPQTLYLWDAAARAGLTYRNYGEFIATLSEADVAAIKRNRAKSYPDISPTVSAFPTKKALEGHHSVSFRTFDTNTPDAMTAESYRASRESAGQINPLISAGNGEAKFRGTSRFGEWLEDFNRFVGERLEGKPENMPNLSILRLPNDHTNGIKLRNPTPQFLVADSDYALGKLVEAVSNSPYWKDTAIFVIEDDAQDGPDHVDAHRSPALVISAYNKPGLLIHEFHNTVSLIRTMELLIGIEPMNQLDANATPINIFRAEADLQPYQARVPNVSLDNLMTQPARDAASAFWMRRTDQQDMSHADMADPEVLNRIIWFSVQGRKPMPESVRLPLFEAMRLGLKEESEQWARNKNASDPD